MSTTGSPPGADPQRPYRGRLIAVGTRHGKAGQLAAPFADVLGARLITPADLDTDQFGTFSGEVSRTGSAAAAARAKARLAMAVTGLPFGVASEASYGPLTASGVAGHEEILLFCDAERGFEVITGHRGPTGHHTGHRVTAPDEVPAALLAGLPEQGLIVRPAAPAGREPLADAITKGITDVTALGSAVLRAAAVSADGHAIVEPDLRAHHNPSRRQVLARLGSNLAHRLATHCSACGTPGFGRVDVETGLECRACGTPTALPRNEIHGCPLCEHAVVRPLSADGADPADCPYCNP